MRSTTAESIKDSPKHRTRRTKKRRSVRVSRGSRSRGSPKSAMLTVAGGLFLFIVISATLSLAATEILSNHF